LRRTAGRVDRIEGPVAGDTRGRVRIGNERAVKGNQIAPARYQYLSNGLGTHASSVGGFAVNRHVRRYGYWVGSRVFTLWNAPVDLFVTRYAALPTRIRLDQLGATYGHSLFSVDCRYLDMQMNCLND
jgi:hypothetical protein